MQGHQRPWDETKSPQWKYLLSKENRQRKLKREKEIGSEDGELTTQSVSKRKRLRKESRAIKKKTKAGKEIVYSASPGRFYDAEMNIMKEMKKMNNNAESNKTT